MNFIKRAFLSITARVGKTMLLVLVLGVIANMVLAGLSIESAAKKSGEFARKKLGGAVTLEADFDKVMSKQMSSGNIGNLKLDIPELTVEEAEKLKNLSHVAVYNYTTSGMALTDGFKAVEVNSESGNKAQIRIGGSSGAAQPEISISGALYSELLSDFTEGNSKLVEGRQISNEDVGKNVAMIEKNLASSNGLKLGDKVKIDSLDGKKNMELEIVGIFEAKINESDAMGMNIAFLSPYNKIYTPYDIASGIKSVISEESSSKAIGSAIYYLDDPLYVEKFKEEAKNTGIDFEKFKLDAKDSLFKQMMGPIENVASFSSTVVLLVTAAGAIILALIIILSLKDRKYEIGVLLSIGEGRFKIIGQLLVETALIAVIAFGISTFTGKFIANEVGNSLLQKEVNAAKNQELEQAKGPKMIRIGPGGIMNNSSASVEAIESIDVSVTKDDLKRLSLLGMLIVFVSTIAPAVSILRFNPKTILTRNE
jgi:putative ABC transport system permease protein